MINEAYNHRINNKRLLRKSKSRLKLALFDPTNFNIY